MKTITELKEKIKVGARMSTKVFWTKNNEYVLITDMPDREISIVQSNGFALKTWKEEEKKFVDSWCKWPKKNEFFPVDEVTFEVRWEGGKLVYSFL